MSLLVTALAFFVLITGLILIHELGHYAAARYFGVTVEEFGFGLPPRIFTLFRKGGTVFSINAIPFGGFVRLRGENDPAGMRAKGSFSSASLFARAAILVAGVFMNFLLAILLFTFGFRFGGWVPTYTSVAELRAAGERGEVRVEMGVYIDDITAAQGAAQAHVSPGSFLRAIDGTPISDPAEVLPLQEGKSFVTYTLETRSPTVKTETLRVAVREGKTGIGIRAVPLVLESVSVSLPKAFGLSLREAKVVMAQTVAGMVHLFTSLASTATVPEGITGIVGIAQLTHTSVQEGWTVYLRLVALLSLSLAALNILPFPALDGGRLIFVLAEGIRRKPTDRTVELVANTVGFVVLIALIVLVTLSDVIRLFS